MCHAFLPMRCTQSSRRLQPGRSRRLESARGTKITLACEFRVPRIDDAGSSVRSLSREIEILGRLDFRRPINSRSSSRAMEDRAFLFLSSSFFPLSSLLLALSLFPPYPSSLRDVLFITRMFLFFSRIKSFNCLSSRHLPLFGSFSR